MHVGGRTRNVPMSYGYEHGLRITNMKRIIRLVFSLIAYVEGQIKKLIARPATEQCMRECNKPRTL